MTILSDYISSQLVIAIAYDTDKNTFEEVELVKVNLETAVKADFKLAIEKYAKLLIVNLYCASASPIFVDICLTELGEKEFAKIEYENLSSEFISEDSIELTPKISAGLSIISNFKLSIEQLLENDLNLIF